MKKNKLMIIIPIVVVLIIGIIVLIALGKKNEVEQPTIPSESTVNAEADRKEIENVMVSTIIRDNPEITEDEAKELLNKPLSDEQKEIIMETIDEMNTIPDIERPNLEDLTISDFESIPDNVIAQINEDGTVTFVEIYPSEFSSLQEYEAYLEDLMNNPEDFEEYAENLGEEIADSQGIAYTPPEVTEVDPMEAEWTEEVEAEWEAIWAQKEADGDSGSLGDLE